MSIEQYYCNKSYISKPLTVLYKVCCYLSREHIHYTVYTRGKAFGAKTLPGNCKTMFSKGSSPVGTAAEKKVKENVVKYTLSKDFKPKRINFLK